jgi:hypothetical protein
VGGTYQVEPGQDVVSGGGRFHGKGGTKVSYDGMGMENSSGNNSYQLNAASVEEMVMSTSGISADTNADGIRQYRPERGRHNFRTTSGLFANSDLESTNLSQELKDRGLLTANKTLKVFEESLSVGGPIKRDHLWFFVAPRTWGVARSQAGTYWNKTQNEFLTPGDAPWKVVKWTPWVDRPEDRLSGRLEWYDSILSRVTWQATAKNKFNFTYDEQRACNCGSVSAAQSHEYYLSSYRFEPNRLFQATWSSPITSRLLLEAGYAATISQWNMFYQPGVQPDIISITDIGIGQSYGAANSYLGFPNSRDRFSQSSSLSYVTGTLNFKTGFQNELPHSKVYTQANGNLTYTFLNGRPRSLTQRATPYLADSKTKYDLGIYAQDQWNVNQRLTLNLGLRWDGFNGYVPEQQAGMEGLTDGWPGALETNQWLGPRTFEARYNIPNWKDWSPRMGISYDLFGNGRTALKAQLGRYLSKLGTDLTEGLNPIATSVVSTTRTWTDNDFDFVPDCDLGIFEANGECTAIDNQNFGKNNPNATRWDPAVLEGYGDRDANWDFSTEVQHELRPGFAVTGGYYYNNGGYTRQGGSRKRVTDNTLVGPEDYDLYCVKAPLDSRLPNGGGYDVCGNANIRQDKFGKVSNLVTARAVRRIREPQRLLQRGGRCPARAGHPGSAAGRHRPLGGRKLLHRRQPRRAAELPRRVAVPRADAVQGARRLPAAGEFRGELRVSEPLGPILQRELHREQRGNHRVARSSALGRRDHRDDSPGSAANDVRGSHHAARPPALALVPRPAIPGPAERGRLQRVERQLDPCAEQHVRSGGQASAAWQRPTRSWIRG